MRRPPKSGYVILGANVVGRHIGAILREGGHEVVFIDANPDLYVIPMPDPAPVTTATFPRRRSPNVRSLRSLPGRLSAELKHVLI